MQLAYSYPLLICIFVFHNLHAQETNSSVSPDGLSIKNSHNYNRSFALPLNQQYLLQTEKQLNYKSNLTHTNFGPYINNFIDDKKKYHAEFSDSSLKQGRKAKWFWRKLRSEHLVIIEGEDYRVTASPVLNVEFGKVAGDTTSYYVNTRGYWVDGNIGGNISFHSEFFENQGRFMPYIRDWAHSRAYPLVPGQGLIKPFKNNGFDYASVGGYISYTPHHSTNIQLGHGKHFIGDGYRSLLLSDFTFNYPYLRTTTQFKKIQYINMYTWFIDLDADRDWEAGFIKKPGSFHLLSYNITSFIQIGLFEGIIWQSNDSLSTGKFNVNYLNPLLFVNTIIYGLNNNNNSVVGLTYKIKPFNKYVLYGQWVIDGVSLNNRLKWGYQVGIKIYDLFGLNNLYIRSEFNSATPYTYNHSYPHQNYSHYGQELAHPLGANFKEWINILGYSFHDFSLELKFNYAKYGADSAQVYYGSNIFVSDDQAAGNTSGGIQGLQTTLMYQDIRVGYLINPATNLNVFIGLSRRTLFSNQTDYETNYFFVGIRTALRNLYYDF